MCTHTCAEPQVSPHPGTPPQQHSKPASQQTCSLRLAHRLECSRQATGPATTPPNTHTAPLLTHLRGKKASQVTAAQPYKACTKCTPAQVDVRGELRVARAPPEKVSHVRPNHPRPVPRALSCPTASQANRTMLGKTGKQAGCRPLAQLGATSTNHMHAAQQQSAHLASRDTHLCTHKCTHAHAHKHMAHPA